MTLTISKLCQLYQAHADTYYRKPISGRLTGEAANVHDSHRALLSLYPDLTADELRVHHLHRLQDYLATGIDPEEQAETIRPVCRSTINQRVKRVCRMYKWAAEFGHVPARIHADLIVVSALKAGRSAAIERPRVLPVPWDDVEDTLGAIDNDLSQPQSSHVRFSREKLRAMIELHWYIGCRPGELVQMRRSTIDTSGEVWIYTPLEHKTEHHFRARRVFIGPRGQAVLKVWFTKCPDDVLFAGRTKQASPLGVEEYAPMSRGSYAQYIARILRRCGIPHWHPNQLRHAAATRFRKETGDLEAVQVALGHANADVTQIYAEKNNEAGIALARQCA